MAEAAEELREKKRVLAALVVHDLRSPLSAIQGYLQLLREELIEDPAVSPTALNYVDDATTLVGKALGLVATILDVDELEDGILKAQLAPVRIIELVDRAKAGNKAQFDVRGLTIETDVDPDMVIRLDRDLFGRVIENLLDNATRYAPRGGRCAISAKRTRGDGAGESIGVEIAIGNNGPPVPSADRDAIFGRYFQVERRRASARQNRGLGLYFCTLAVEAHGGRIWVEDNVPKGSVFVVQLPTVPDQATFRPAPSSLNASS